MASYLRPLIEQYYFINIIPDIALFGLPSHFYFYLFFLLGMGVFLIFIGAAFMQKQRNQKQLKCAKSGFAQIILVLWFIASLPWFITQVHWLANDIDNFYGKSISERQRIAVTNVIKRYALSQKWHDFL
ncbi:hypothetical protein MYX07_06135 [Patescibacteria group bacterium AH-259-L07]|nr:hypothetical protein [Patescibacteria group bacterium AH-259-L07]